MSELCVVTQRSGPLTKTYTTDRFRLVSWAGEQQCRGSPALPMSKGEIVASYRQAAKPAAQITVLADLNACSKERIEEILREAGEPLPKKAGRPKRTEG